MKPSSGTAATKVVQVVPGVAASHVYCVELADSLMELGVTLKSVETIFFVREVLAFRPDIVHIHWLHHFTGTQADSSSWLSRFARLLAFTIQLVIVSATGSKIVWTVHELEIPESHHPELDKMCNRHVASLSHAIVTHCESARSQVLEAYCSGCPGKVKVVPHGNLINALDNTMSRSDARTFLKIPASSLVLLFLGTVRPYKGVTELIEAHRQLNRDDVLLLIVGGPILDRKECADYRDAVEKSIGGRQNVRLILKRIHDQEIQTYMNASDAVVFPYRSILTSGALITAMGFGKPCIASRLGCMAETLDDNGGFLYEPNDPSGLFNALCACLENVEKLPEMGEHNRRLAQNMTWHRIAELTLQAYRGSQ